jgi:APA family basic amino acid/polyamine antiporter/amino acid efflux transporter
MLVSCGAFAAGMPALFLVGGSYSALLLGLPPAWDTPCAMLLAILTTGINLLGAERLGKINGWIVLSIVAVVAFVGIASLPMAAAQYGKLGLHDFSALSLGKVWLAASIVFYAFQGWENMTFGFGEIKDPQRNIPRIYWWSFALVVLVCAWLAIVVSAAALAGHPVHGLSGLAALLPAGPAGRILLGVMVLILFANANACVFSCSRAFYAAAAAGALPRPIAKAGAKGLPANSLLAGLAAYLAVLLAQWHWGFAAAKCFLLSTQCCILLCGAAVLAFIRLSSGWKNRLIACAAIAAWLFLMQGFGWLVAYPLALLGLGALRDWRLKAYARDNANKGPARAMPPSQASVPK